MFKFKKNFSLRDFPIEKNQTSPIKFSSKVSTSPIKFASRNLVSALKLNSNGFENKTTNGQRSPVKFDFTKQACTPENVFTNGHTSPIKQQTTNGLSHQPVEPSNLNVADSISEFDMESDCHNDRPSSKRMKLSMDQIKAQKQEKLKQLDEQVSSKLSSILDIKKKTVELREKRFIIEDYISIVNKSQLEVRNYLNQMYNPGLKVAESAKDLMEEKRQSHDKKLEAVSFELTELLESSHIAIERKTKQFAHEIELHERTLYTLKCRQMAENIHKQQKHEEVEIINHKNSFDIDESNVETKEDTRSVRFETDDECIIIGEDNKQEGNVDKEFDQGREIKLDDTHDSEATNLVEDEEEEQVTDIEEDSTERSFTPCQAQRPQ